MTTKNLGVLFIRLYALVEFISQMLRTLAIILNSGLVRRWDLYPLQILYLLYPNVNLIRCNYYYIHQMYFLVQC